MDATGLAMIKRERLDCANSRQRQCRKNSVGARTAIPTLRFDSIEVSTMGATRNCDQGQQGEQRKYQRHGLNSSIVMP
jgi:hypothetical protein